MLSTAFAKKSYLKSEADIADDPSSGGVIPACITELLSSANLNPENAVEAVVVNAIVKGGGAVSTGVCCSRSTLLVVVDPSVFFTFPDTESEKNGHSY